MNYGRLDLRLLLVFDAMMAEQSATRAAQRIGLSQPAVSSGLNHLRSIFKDELFVRVGNGLQPTPRAYELAAPIHQVLADIGAVFNMRGFDPQRDDRTFTFAMSDHGNLLILPKLAAHLEQNAPNIQIRILPKYNPSVAQLLEDDRIDFAIGFIPGAPAHLHKIGLFQDRYVGVMRPGHPLARSKLSTEDFIAARHVLVTTAGAINALIDRHVTSSRATRRTSITVDNILSASAMVTNSNYVSIMFRKLVDHLTRQGYAKFETLRLPMPAVAVDLFWHPRYNKSEPHGWMRTAIRKIAKTC